MHESAAHTVVLSYRLSRHAGCHTQTAFHVNNTGPSGN